MWTASSGISPAIAIEQKVLTSNPRSTVGTSTEVYDHLKLLFARAGHTIPRSSGQEVKRNTIEDVVAGVNSYPEGSKVLMLCAVPASNGPHLAASTLMSCTNKDLHACTMARKSTASRTSAEKKALKGTWFLVLDRLTVTPGDEETESRAADSAETGLLRGAG